MPKQKISKEKSFARAKTTFEVILCLGALTVAGFIGYRSYKKALIVPETSEEASVIEELEIEEPTVEFDPDRIIFTSVPVETRSRFAGDLILVNNDHEFYPTDDLELISIMEMNDEQEVHHFTAVDYSYMIRNSVYEPMFRMLEDYYNLYQDDTLIIYGSYRTRERQSEIYEQFAYTQNEDEPPRAAPPGFSEHETGYAIDLSEIVNYDYDGTGDQAWINENCYKYGFILRYPEEKKEITQYRYEPWHFRYVGVAHAKYIMQNGLCFEEYIDLLRNNYEYSGEHLNVTDDNANEYEIYFYASDDAADITSVPVPSGYEYDLSGNNVDGFIVTVHKNKPVEPTPEQPPVPTVTDATDAAEETTESDEPTEAPEESTTNPEEVPTEEESTTATASIISI